MLTQVGFSRYPIKSKHVLNFYLTRSSRLSFHFFFPG